MTTSKSWRRRFAACLAAAGFLACGAAAESVSLVKGESSKSIWAEKSASDQNWRGTVAMPRARLSFAPVAPERIDSIREENAKPQRLETKRATQIGLVRLTTLESDTQLQPTIKWHPIAQGYVTIIDIESEGAAGLRAGLRVTGLPGHSELRFGSPEVASKPIAHLNVDDILGQLDENGVYWSPLTDGGLQRVEVFVSGQSQPVSAGVEIVGVSHLFVSAKDGFAFPKRASASCNVDAVCGSATLAYANAKSAVAKMVFQDGGGTYLCTGTLLNDTDPSTQVPYFYSARHCINSQSSANTLITYWFYDNAVCGGVDLPMSQATAVFGGAYLDYEDQSTDVLLLRLKQAPPPGAYFSGWDPGFLAGGNSIGVLHHPMGDPKKVSVGESRGFIGSFHDVGYLSGTTEGGSSGAGLLTLISGEYFLHGGLYGGSATCANSGNMANAGNQDRYSRLDLAFPSIRKFVYDPAPVVSAAAGAGGTISPAMTQSTPWGSSLTFTVTPNPGFSVAVGGTCGGLLTGTIFKTAAITANCTVAATFTVSPNATSTFYGTGVGAIPDSSQVGPQSPTGQLVIQFPVSGLGQGAPDISLMLSMTHSRIGDLRAVLAAPGGSPSVDVLIYTGATNPAAFGYSTDLDGNYVFGDRQTGPLCLTATSNSNGSLPPGGYYVAAPINCARVGVNAIFAGMTPAQLNGVWTLSITDGASGEVGQVTAAALSLTVPYQPHSVSPSFGANGTMSPAIPQVVNQGNTLLFTVTPDPGYYAVMGGTCGGSLVGSTYTTNPVFADCTVTASFAVMTTVPAAPVLLSAIPADQTAFFAFSTPASGGSQVLQYAVTCDPGALVAIAPSSPIMLSGLANDVTYVCSIAATNSVGTGPSSANLSVTPSATAPLALVAIRSRKTHGNAGDFSVDADFAQLGAGQLPVEPRAIGAGHRIAFEFSRPIANTGTLSVVNQLGVPIVGASTILAGKEMIMTFANVNDGDRLTIQLNGIDGTSLDVSASIRFLVGDANASGSTTASDISAAKAHLNQATNSANFAFDVDFSGQIDQKDLTAIKARAGRGAAN